MEGIQYHLICEECGELFWDVDGYLDPQLCPDCDLACFPELVEEVKSRLESLTKAGLIGGE